ncbi:MAG: hypothetical protein D3910_26460 [Candidatus Electrothrix sp. ATG2]|nr:hypothetical protein [Candidatus Electrothrix sp. ATG2]
MTDLEYHLTKFALLGSENECGDTGLIIERDKECFFALVDILGHGQEAHEVAELAEEYLQHHYGEPLLVIMQGLHDTLKGTRGGVAAIGRLDRRTGNLELVGIGNITVRIIGAQATRFIMGDGIIGYIMSTPKKISTRLYSGDLLLLYSDGIKEFFDPDAIPGLLTHRIEEITDLIIQQFGKNNDDTSCIALRFRK